MALVRRQGGSNAAVRNAWEIEINAMLATKMSFTLCMEWPFRIMFRKILHFIKRYIIRLLAVSKRTFTRIYIYIPPKRLYV